MKLQRNDWLISDGDLKEKAQRWWFSASVGLAAEALMVAGLCWESRLPGPWASAAVGALVVRAICGSIGAYCWFSASKPPEFWGCQARWVMQFFPSACLSWRRKVWIDRFIERLGENNLEKMIELSGEQHEYYNKGASLSSLGAIRREMSSWAAAVRECQSGWESKLEAEKMKSPKEREEALEKLGLGKTQWVKA